MDMQRTPRWPAGDGEMAERVRDRDWSATPLGPTEGWSQPLKTAVETMLAMPLLATLAIGPERVFLYNDHAVAHYGARHPAALGRPLADVFAYEFHHVAGFYDRVFAGEAVHVPAQPLDPAESGTQEVFDAYLTPVRDDAGTVIAALMTGFAIGDRLRAAAALRESEMLRRVAVAGGRMGTWRWDLSQRLIWGDAQFLALWGFSASDEPQPLAQFTERMSPEGATEMEAIVTSAVAADEEFDRPLEIVSGPTAGHWIRWRGRAAEGDVHTLYGVTFDITDQVRADAALRESEARLAAAFESVPAGVAVLDTSGTAILSNAEYRRFLPTGVIPSRDPGRAGRWQAWDDQGRRLGAENYPGSRALRGEAAVLGQEMLFTDDDGREIWTNVATAPTFDKAGQVTGAVSVISDIDARKRADQVVRESEDRLRRIIDTSAVGVLFFDPDGFLIDANDAFLTMAGYSRERVRSGSLHWRDMTPPEWIGPSEEQMARFSETDRLGPYEKEYYRADGSRSWMLFSGRGLADGTIVEFAVDISERKRVETALRESEERLAFLLRLTDALRPLTDSGEIERQATRLLGEHLKADRCFLSPVYDDGSGMCVREEYLRAGASSVLGDYTFAQFGEFVGPTLHAGHILAVEDVSELTGLSAAERESYAAVEIGAYLLIPLVRDGRLAAFLTINHRTPRHWSEADKAVARQTADRLWMARERAHAEAALRESEARLRQFGEASHDVLWIRDAETLQWTYLTPAFEAIYGLSRDKALKGDDFGSWLDLIEPEDRAHAAAMIERVGGGEHVTFEYRVRRPVDGQIRWLRDTDFPIADASGKVVMIGGVGSDFTDEKHAQERLEESEERLRVMVAELQHRVRNILTVVRSVFGRTMQRDGDLEELADHFSGRLGALARTQVVVTRTARGRVDLEDLLRDELMSIGVQEGPALSIVGPDVELPPKVAEPLGLALHELTTNALKYGAFRAPTGRLSVSWTVNMDCGGKRRLNLVWHEQGVPAMPIEPVRRGFGSELIEQALSYSLKAETELAFRPGGVRCTIGFDLPEDDGALDPLGSAWR